MAASPPVIYLDTQDYSRFGGVVEGRGNAADETLYRRLVDLAEAGDAIFACSMPILGELLSYDEAMPHISEAKARAVEALCRGHALSYPTELVALEVARVAAAENMIPAPPVASPLSNDYGWFPDVGDMFVDIRRRFRSEGAQRISALAGVNRAKRREVKSKFKRLDPADALVSIVPEFAEKYGLPASAVEHSVGDFLRGRTTSREASRRMFSTIATPTNFVHAYFRVYEGEKELPEWMASTGRNLAASLLKFQQAIAAFPARTSEQQRSLRKTIEDNTPNLSAIVLKAASDDAGKFGVSAEMLASIGETPSLVERIPGPRNLGLILSAYVAQTLGLAGTAAKVEHSFGGDVVHALYLSHVDLWRADRRFGHVAATALKDRADRIVTRLAELPERIDAWNRQGSSGLSVPRRRA